jgi:hypothetical protein
MSVKRSGATTARVTSPPSGPGRRLGGGVPRGDHARRGADERHLPTWACRHAVRSSGDKGTAPSRVAPHPLRRASPGALRSPQLNAAGLLAALPGLAGLRLSGRTTGQATPGLRCVDKILIGRYLTIVQADRRLAMMLEIGAGLVPHRRARVPAGHGPGRTRRVESEYPRLLRQAPGSLGTARLTLRIDVGLGNATEPPMRDEEYRVLLEGHAPRIRALLAI